MLKVIIHFWKYFVVNITALVWATVKVSHKDWMLKLINRLVHKFEILRLAAKRRWSMCMNRLSMCMNYQQCSWTITNVHELSTMCMNYQQCAWTINNVPYTDGYWLGYCFILNTLMQNIKLWILIHVTLKQLTTGIYIRK